MTLPYTYNQAPCFAFNAQTEPLYEKILAKTEQAYAELQIRNLPLFKELEAKDDIAALLEIASKIRAKFRHVALLGTGGSTLSGQAIAPLSQNADTPQFHFMDNVDPCTWDCFLDTINWQECFFLIISKSGNTLETIAQTALCLNEAEKRLGKTNIPDHFLLITNPASQSTNHLHELADAWRIPIIDHSPGIGGRFSVFTNVGMLPALILGLDTAAFREGAMEVLHHPHAACEGAALHFALMQQGIRHTVLMPYIDRLERFALWFRQIWAESLGKGGNGTTPVNALGTLDQHSQLQLYLDGPNDKLITLITLDQRGKGRILHPAHLPKTIASEIGGSTLGDVMEAEQRATFETLARRQRPVRMIFLSELNEHTMGALLMHFMLETILTAKLLGIDAFDQPAVEEGKKLAHEYLKQNDCHPPASGYSG